MATNKKLSELLGDKSPQEQAHIIARVLYEVGGLDWPTAFMKGDFYVFKAQFAGGAKRPFASLSNQLSWHLYFHCVRKCIEEFYFANITLHETMKRGYWRCIFEVLNAHKYCGRLFSIAFDLTGCRQEEGKYIYREKSYWISSRIVEHYAGVKKIADTQAAREQLQQDIARALRNKLPDDHECVKADFAQRLAEWAKNGYAQ